MDSRASLDGQKRAAQYIRMSTDHQKYSTAAQSEANHAHAARRGLVIVRTYIDEGRSGLNIERRRALRRLIEDVEKGHADYETILVYDVSRWGRFQDVDESAHYEYVCRRAGINVVYCVEQFENDGSLVASLLKSIKRAMAAEFSRDLSVRTFARQSRVVQLGYRLGGSAGYGLRRLLVSHAGIRKGVLQYGEHKAIASDRIVLVPGPAEEVAAVRWIFQAFTRDHLVESEIAAILNERGLKNDLGRPWNRYTVKHILQNEKYIGNNVWGRESFRLQIKRVQNSPDLWVRANGVFKPIVEKSVFDAAQAVYHDRLEHPIVGRVRIRTDEEMLQALRNLLLREGRLTKRIIDQSNGIQSCGAYLTRFGSLTKVYEKIGYIPNKRRQVVRAWKRPLPSDEVMLAMLKRLLQERGCLSQAIIDQTLTVPHRNSYLKRFGSLKRVYELLGYAPDYYARLSPRPRNLSDEQMLDALRKLWRETGNLNQETIDGCKDVPSYHQYYERFGSLGRAYGLIGFTPKHQAMTRHSTAAFARKALRRPRGLSDSQMLDALRELWHERGRLSQALIDESRTLPSANAYRAHFGSLSRAYELIGYRMTWPTQAPCNDSLGR